MDVSCENFRVRWQSGIGYTVSDGSTVVNVANRPTINDPFSLFLRKCRYAMAHGEWPRSHCKCCGQFLETMQH